jgi:hypothetical protein
MRPSLWRPPVELSCTEQAIINRIKRAKLFVFLGSLTAMSYLMTLFKKNWRRSMPRVSVGTLPFRQRN